jgi:hypothetical protein
VVENEPPPKLESREEDKKSLRTTDLRRRMARTGFRYWRKFEPERAFRSGRGRALQKFVS